MESLTDLATLVAELGNLSRDILEEGMTLLDQKEEIVDAVLESRPDAKAATAEVYVQEAIVELLKDAEETDRDIAKFAEALSAVEPRSSDEFTAACPFLAGVWYGDEYDETGLEALKSLRDELQTQYDALTVEEVAKATEALLDKN